MTQPRIRVAESALQKAGALGLDYHSKDLSKLIKQMARLSAIASGNFNDERRRYGDFIITLRDNTVVDINVGDTVDSLAEVCFDCLGTDIMLDGQLCICVMD